MRTYRNVAFVLFLAIVVFPATVSADGQSFCAEHSGEGDCSWWCSGFVADLYEIYDCEALYPSFCDDAWSDCLDQCLNEAHSLPDGFMCYGGSEGACEAECVCVECG
jgi:hypothetical protein